MSVKEQMATAKAYIADKQYDKARKILKKIEHPTAEKWLKQLNSKHPPKPMYKKRWFRVVSFLGVFLISCGLIYIVVLQPQIKKAPAAQLLNRAP